MIRLVEENKYNFNYLLSKYEFPNYEKYKGNNKILYHNTYLTNVDYISKNGLLCDKAKAEIDIVGTIPMIWAVDVGGGSGYGGCTIAFENNTTNYDKVNNTDVTLYEDIPPKDILFIDTWVCNRNHLKRVSDVPKLIKKFGIDKVREVFTKHKQSGAKFFYDIDYLLDVASKNL